ncbi:hypothetical protein AQUCO_04900030v1 [Aquilegia coerulea]|uniref:MBD domain-containing protein n=1 Tax=Aquilegia coerulea TaxID=218851 RepID=A0A2G5CJH2_AQUCA|nr:hypothetical protein AQUCO_04900030v1 [Aquilegia coerulea]
MGKGGNQATNIKKTTVRSRVKFLADSAEGLPKGWKVEIKTRKRGTKVGGQYKCYVAPVTGYKCYSKGEVSRYLKSRPKTERRPLTDSETHVVIEKFDEVDGLPPGWTLELKIRKKGARIRNDPYYTDPVSGYVFRSRKDVMRYLKTGKLGKYAFKPKEGELKSVKKLEAKTSNSISDEAVKDDSILQYSTEGISPSDSSDQSEENSQVNQSSIETKNSKKRNGKNVAVKGSISVSPTTVQPSEKQTLENGVEDNESRNTKLGSRKRKTKQLDSPIRFSKRLAAISANQASDMKNPNKTPQVAALQPSPDAKLAMHSTADRGSLTLSEQLNQLESVKEGHSISHVITGGKSLMQQEFNVGTDNQSTTGHASRCEEPLNQSTTAHATRCEEPLKQGVFYDGREEKTPTHGAPQLSVNQAIHRTVEVEKKVDEKLESPFTLPFGDSWPDPCLEFAFKTLTGAISVEDNLAVQDYFQHQLSSAPNINNAVETTQTSNLALTETKSSRKRKGKKAVANLGLPSARPAAEEHGNRKTRFGSRKKTKELSSTLRISKRLARSNANLASEMVNLNGASVITAVQPSPEAKLAMNSTSGSCYLYEQLSLLESLKEGGSIAHPTTVKEPFMQEGYHVGTDDKRISAQVTRGEEPLKQGERYVETEDQASKHGQMVEVWDQASLKMVEVEAKADEKLKSPFQSPFGDSWPDPCLEFAFKTLTGAIPLEDNMAVQDYFQHQLSSAQTHNEGVELPDFGIDDFSQTEKIFQFDSTKPPSPNKLQVSTSSGMLGFSNNNVLQHPGVDEKIGCERRGKSLE